MQGISMSTEATQEAPKGLRIVEEGGVGDIYFNNAKLTDEVRLRPDEAKRILPILQSLLLAIGSPKPDPAVISPRDISSAFVSREPLTAHPSPPHYDQFIAMLKEANVKHERSYVVPSDSERRKDYVVAVCKQMEGNGDMEGFYGQVALRVFGPPQYPTTTNMIFNFDAKTGKLIDVARSTNIEDNIF
jgi:hypothetical protein